MHNTSARYRFSPANFVLGCWLTLSARTAVTHRQALQPLMTNPRRVFGSLGHVAFAILAGLALLLAVIRGLGRGAPAAMERAAPSISAHAVATTVAVVVFLAFCALLTRVLRSAGRGYMAMCLVGHAHREQLLALTPIVRCYTRQD